MLSDRLTFLGESLSCLWDLQHKRTEVLDFSRPKHTEL